MFRVSLRYSLSRPLVEPWPFPVMVSDGEDCPSHTLPVALLCGNSRGPGGRKCHSPSGALRISRCAHPGDCVPEPPSPLLHSGSPGGVAFLPHAHVQVRSPPGPVRLLQPAMARLSLGRRPVNLGRQRDLIFDSWMGKGQIPPRWGHRTQRAPPAPTGWALQTWPLPAGPQIHSRGYTCTRSHQHRDLGGGCH